MGSARRETWGDRVQGAEDQTARKENATTKIDMMPTIYAYPAQRGRFPGNIRIVLNTQILFNANRFFLIFVVAT